MGVYLLCEHVMGTIDQDQAHHGVPGRTMRKCKKPLLVKASEWCLYEQRLRVMEDGFC